MALVHHSNGGSDDKKWQLKYWRLFKRGLIVVLVIAAAALFDIRFTRREVVNVSVVHHNVVQDEIYRIYEHHYLTRDRNGYFGF